MAGYSLFVDDTPIGTTGQTAYTFSGLACGTSYTLGVEAYDAAGNRSPRVALKTQTSSCPAPSPAPAPGPTSGGDIFLNPSGGSDTNPCTQAQPCASFSRAYQVAKPGNGYYRLDVPDAAFAAGSDGVLIHGIVTGMVVIGCYVQLVAYDPFDAVRLGLTALPGAAAEAAGGLYTRGTGAGQINQPANGRIDANVVAVSGTTQTARDLGASVLISSGTGTGQLSVTSGVVQSNMVQILSAAITGTAAQIVAAFTKWFNVATPTGTVNSLPDAVPGAAGGVFIAGTNAATSITTALTANVTGNVSGSVGSVTGAVGSVSGNVAGNVTGSVGSLAAQAKTDVNNEVLDVLTVDTFTEPTQGAPGVNISLKDKIGYLYKAFRNRITQTATTLSIYADDASTVDHKSTTTDDGTTYSRGEISTGP